GDDGEAVAQAEDALQVGLRHDEAGGGGETGCRGIADRIANGGAVQDSRAAADDRLARSAANAVREAGAGSEIVPVGGERALRDAVLSGEGDDTRRSRDRVDGRRVEGVHPIVYDTARQLGLPSQADV